MDIGLNVSGNFSYARANQKGGFFGENQVGGTASSFARSLFLARNWDLNLPYEDKQGKPLTPNGGGQFDHPRWSARYTTAATDELSSMDALLPYGGDAAHLGPEALVHAPFVQLQHRGDERAAGVDLPFGIKGDVG